MACSRNEQHIRMLLADVGKAFFKNRTECFVCIELTADGDYHTIGICGFADGGKLLNLFIRIISICFMRDKSAEETGDYAKQYSDSFDKQVYFFHVSSLHDRRLKSRRFFTIPL